MTALWASAYVVAFVYLELEATCETFAGNHVLRGVGQPILLQLRHVDLETAFWAR